MAKIKGKASYCLARTSKEWFDFIINNKYNDFANFWKPCEQAFHALVENGKMYLYDSVSKAFIGVATFSGTSAIKDIGTAWKDYNVRNGQPSLQSFKDLLFCESNTGKKFMNEDKICCIELLDIKEFKIPMPYNYDKQQMIKKLFDDMPENKNLIRELEGREVK